VVDMTEISTPTPQLRATPEQRRARIIGCVELAMAAFVLFIFGLGEGSDADATLKLALPRDRFDPIDWVVNPRRVGITVAIVLALLAGIQLARGFGRRANLVLGVAMALFVFSFLSWAAAGQSFSLIGMLSSTIVLSVPVTLGGLTGLMGERVGVINIGIEGQLLTGAFVGTVIGSSWGRWPAVFVAMAAGALLGWVLAVLSIKYFVDQIVAGVAINIFALGLTSFLATRVLSPNPQFNSPERFRSIDIPLLEDIPILGNLFFKQNVFLYGTLLLVVVIHVALFHTRWGLRSRAVGEHPKAVDTVGIDVFWIRYRNVVLAGAIAGFGGAALTLGSTGRFEANMTAGVGYIGLAAMIFGRWRPFGVLGAALVFGFARSLQQKLGILGTNIPSEFLSMAPYVVTIIVVAGLIGHARAPAADGQPYVKD
jgi:general nucleoside transport system permease protein